MSGGRPLVHLNLWRNPFGELTATERMRLAICDIGEDVDWLQSARPDERRILEFIGPCGHGKSTHLRALQLRLGGAVYVYVPPQPPYPVLPSGIPLIIDEADRLPLAVRWRMYRRTDVVAVGVHRSLANAFTRHGIVTRTIEVANRGQAERLRKMLNRRILASVRLPGAVPLISAGDARYLILRYGDDIRAIEGYLYERFQQL